MRGPLKRGDPKGRSVRTWRDHAPPMAGRLTSRARQKLGLAPCCKYADDTLRSDSTGNTSSTRIYRWPERSAGRTDCFPAGHETDIVEACHIIFRDEDAAAKVLSAPRIEELLGYRTNYKDLMPSQSLLTAL